MAESVRKTMSDDLCLLDAVTQAELIRQRQISPVELMQASLERAQNIQARCNPFCFIYADEALEAAREAEKAVMSGAALPALHGLPIAIKDFTPTKGKRTTRGSVAFEHWIPDRDALIVKRLKAQGAILLGKTTTPEFAWSSFTQSRLWGPTLNPWNATHTSGGSSGGSAVAVTTGCVSLAEGTDMGGSVRIPAALCGIVGHKPSLGRIPMDILDTVYDSISHFGPLARSVRDAALFMNATQGPDESDIQSQKGLEPLPISMQPADDTNWLSGTRIAVSEDLGFYSVDDEVLANLRCLCRSLEEAGATLVDVNLDWQASVASNWMSYWAVFLAASFEEQLNSHEKDIDPDLVELMKSGQRLSAVEFKQLETARTRQWQVLAKVLTDADFLLCPTMTMTAPEYDRPESEFERIDAAGKLQGLDMTAPFNSVAQCPVMSVPSGIDKTGLPTAVQIVGQRYNDESVFRLASIIESIHPWKRWTGT